VGEGSREQRIIEINSNLTELQSNI